MKSLFIIALIALAGCTPDDDCGCGTVTANTNDGTLWIITWQDECSGRVHSDTFHFPMQEVKVGDRICELFNLEVK